MQRVFNALNGEIEKYNWLITDSDCYPENPKTAELLNREYAWLSGKDLVEMVEEENFQWIWAVLSGFRPEISLETALKEQLPHEDVFAGFLRNPLTLWHPLASVEIVPWDSSFVLLLSKNPLHIEMFKKAFPRSKDLVEYNNR